tara:strand:+ start:1273 stop:1497 length:225 start_codon:yes stop_codon:yes gene_type:complete
MKFVLTLYLFSFVNIQQPIPLTTHIVPLEFSSYKDCILHGYKASHNTLKELYGDRIDNEKLAIKFECIEITKGA